MPLKYQANWDYHILVSKSILEIRILKAGNNKMILIAGIAALICAHNGNVGGAIVALGVGAILHALLDGGSNDND